MNAEVVVGVLAVVGGVIGLAKMALGSLNKVMSQNAAREIASREANKQIWDGILETQKQIAVELRNHMSDDREALTGISQHMGETVEALRGLRDIMLVKPKGRRS